ncbi:hypothetical protein AAFF_G00230480 [Aldrovandia affinis]|uniref:Uncharacterized protein n=1 Tax=Aldrovandia affinis TaxID=143900 RepID=A0AAD7RFI3_9TELE|nr:hypothetical protein AAFF_G00230480 [Aldrovandia affinis]
MTCASQCKPDAFWHLTKVPVVRSGEKALATLAWSVAEMATLVSSSRRKGESPPNTSGSALRSGEQRAGADYQGQKIPNRCRNVCPFPRDLCGGAAGEAAVERRGTREDKDPQ